ncbi:hypothetical protein HanRHA438_Chr14g0675491 [Helianthus annuus]|nr:hypothetical protein HanRHA438_Chr14g0675491 [Helianthus annuus]
MVFLILHGMEGLEASRGSQVSKEGFPLQAPRWEGAWNDPWQSVFLLNLCIKKQTKKSGRFTSASLSPPRHHAHATSTPG